MECSKYTIINTGSTVINFNYRRCDDSLWQYQVEVNPNQVKNVWLINDTFSIATPFLQGIIIDNQGDFPPIPTPIPVPPLDDLTYTIIPNDDITYIIL
jgi:hypothetical protein